MIETKEQYEHISADYLDDFRYGRVAHKDVLETIEALREVARAANRMNIQLKGLPHAPLTKALAALPDWITDG